MKKLLLHLTSFLALGFFVTLMSNCTEEEESSSNIVGVWNVTTVEFDAYVNGNTLEQYYLNDLGFSQEETNLALSIFEDEVASYMIGAKIEFEADYYYWTNIGDPAGDDGEWSINSSETVITLDAGTIYETQVTINSLANSSLNISFEMQEEMDLDEDPQTPEVTVDLHITMALSK